MNKTDKSQSPLWMVMLSVVLIASIAGWWFQRRAAAQAEAERANLQKENQAMREQLARLQAPPAAGVPAAAPISTNVTPVEATAAAKPPAGPTMVLTPTGEALPPRFDGLTLYGTHVVPVPGGLKATMRFTPTTKEALGVVAVVVRLPRDSDARIIDLGQSGGAPMDRLFKRISDDGKFVVFQGTAEVVGAMELALSVSGPATADVRGTCGIGPFSLKVTESGASAE